MCTCASVPARKLPTRTKKNSHTASVPQGAYIKEWLPELRFMPPKHVHAPWEAPADVLSAAGVRLGETYPHRIVAGELRQLRAASVEAVRELRAAAPPGAVDAGGYDVITVPPGSTTAHDGRPMRIFTKPEHRRGIAAPLADGTSADGTGDAPAAPGRGGDSRASAKRKVTAAAKRKAAGGARNSSHTAAAAKRKAPAAVGGGEGPLDRLLRKQAAL